MKKILSMAALCSLILTVSCNKEEQKSVDKDFQYVIPAEAIVGETVTFEDQSINVQSREWTFEDGTPATSTKAIEEVVFNKAGEKTVSLTVNYSDGTKDEISKKITIKDAFSATIKAEGLSPKGCAKKGSEITFSLDEFKNAAGGNVSYAWTFPGATPATSTDASPKVVWNEQDNNVKVTCVVTRELDGAKLNLEKTLIAGNYPLLKVDDYDVYGFEKGESNVAWYTWVKFSSDEKAGLHPEVLAVVDGGANGTAKAMRIDISDIQDGANILELAARNSWPTNAWMEAGKKYELSFWLKAEGAIAACYWLNIFSYCPTWLNDPLRGTDASADWKEVFGVDFVESSQTKLYENVITSVTPKEDGSGYDVQNALTADWTKYTFEITLEGETGTVYKNCYPAFGFSGIGAKVYIDEVQINLIEE